MDRRNQILIVDDMEINRAILHQLFQENYTVLEAENGAQALTLVRENRDSIAVILLDIIMPVMDGFQLMEQLQKENILNRIPVILITADTYRDNEIKGLNLGASDIIIKPFDPHIVRKRVQNSVELYRHKNHLEDLVALQTKKLTETNDFVVDALSTVIEYRSLESGQHIRRIRVFTRTLLECVMQCCPEYHLTSKKIDSITSASALHDVGKIAIPDSILLKPGRLTHEEFEVMKEHTTKGCDILRAFHRMEDKSYLRDCYHICRYHHERYDGRGYPDGRKGEEIPLCAQVVAVADVYDALTSARVYKPAIPHEEAVKMILTGECGVFSTKLLDCFMQVHEHFRQIGETYRDDAKQTEALPHPVSSQDELWALEESSRTELSKALQEASLSLQKEALERDALVNAIPGGVAKVDIDDHFRILLASDGFYKHTGYSRAEYSSPPINGQGAALILEEDIPHLMKNVYEQISKDLPLYAEYRIRRKNGSIAWINAHGLRVENEQGRNIYQAVFVDCTDTKRIEQKLLSLMNSVPGGIAQIQLGKGISASYASDGFYQLGGYPAEEFEQHFSGENSLLIFHPDDRQKCRQKIQQLLTHKDRQFTFESRVLHKNGNVTWCLINGVRTEDESSNETVTYQCVFSDISESRRVQELLNINEKRFRILIEQVQDVIFDWDMVSDTMYHSPAFEKKFGYQMPVNHFFETILKSDILHEEDRDNFESFHQQLLHGASSAENEYRFKSQGGEYIWCCVRATVIYNRSQIPVRTVGILSDVDDYKKKNEMLEAKAQKDLLTGVYNKVTMENLIEDFLTGDGQKQNHALFIIDIDNFKNINDTFGHWMGDRILRDVSSSIQERFRLEDIIGRAGGDEFVVFLKNIPSREQARKRAETLSSIFHQLTEVQDLHTRISGSIGISIFPEDGGSFSELYRNADKALYISKRAGKDCYTFFPQEEETS